MGTGSGGPIGVSPFHSRGALKGFVISGRWPDSTKEWAQLLMVAVRVASLPGLLSTTTCCCRDYRIWDWNIVRLGWRLKPTAPSHLW